MKKDVIKQIIAQSINSKDLCRVFFKYDENYYYYYPVAVSDKLFMGAKEDDFTLDGYSIRRFRDTVKVEIREDKCYEINIKEGVVDQILSLDVDVTDWQTVFNSLKKFDKNIIIEDERDVDNRQFAIGRIEEVYKKHLLFRHFDAHGLWMQEPYIIRYSSITSVTFDARYVNIFSKYLSPLPDNFKK